MPLTVPERNTRRRSRYNIHARLRTISSRAGGRWCMSAAGTQVTIGRDAGGHAVVGGVKRCGSPWSCFACSPKVREGRAREIDAGLGHALAEGMALWFVSFTLPHTRDQPLKASLDALQGAWRATWSGNRGKTLRAVLGLAGTIRAVEVTHGFANGWHPHIHAVFVCDRTMSREHVDQAVRAAWTRSVTALGWARPGRHGVDVRPVTDTTGVAAYTAKVEAGWGAALELARTDVKRGRHGSRSVTEIGELAAEGEDVHLWREYEETTAGRRAMWWSAGLKARLGVDERSDEELAEEGEAVERHVLVLDAAEWEWYVRTGRVGELLDLVEGAPLPVLLRSG